MAESTMRVLLDDGPREGETIEVQARPDGAPPEQIVVADPLSLGISPDERVGVDPETPGSTTYHLHESQGLDGLSVYRTGLPD